MRAGTLTYDGTTYRLDAAAVADLLARSVIRADPMFGDQFELVPDHVIAEVEPFATFRGYESGEEVRGGSADDGRRRLFTVSFQHRDGQGR